MWGSPNYGQAKRKPVKPALVTAVDMLARQEYSENRLFEKLMDKGYEEAARDLGASPAKAFLTVTLKLTMPGLLTGVILTFVPSMGLFFIADILGGNKIVLLGNVIQEQLMKVHDWPFAAALSVILMAMTSVMIWTYRRISKAQETEGSV